MVENSESQNYKGYKHQALWSFLFISSFSWQKENISCLRKDNIHGINPQTLWSDVKLKEMLRLGGLYLAWMLVD